MSLDNAYALGFDAGRCEEFLEEVDLCRDVGLCDGFCMRRVVDLDAADDAEDVVILGDSVGQPLEDEHAATLSAAVPVRRCIPRLALARGTEEMGAVETEIHLNEFR